MSGVGYKEKRMLSCPDVISSNGTWNLGAEYYLAICKRTSFFHHKMRHVGVCQPKNRSWEDWWRTRVVQIKGIHALIIASIWAPPIGYSSQSFFQFRRPFAHKFPTYSVLHKSSPLCCVFAILQCMVFQEICLHQLICQVATNLYSSILHFLHFSIFWSGSSGWHHTSAYSGNGNINLSDWSVSLCTKALFDEQKAHYKNKRTYDKGLPIRWASCVVAAL